MGGKPGGVLFEPAIREVNKNAGFVGCVASMFNHIAVGHEIAQHLWGFLSAVARFLQFVTRPLYYEQIFRDSVAHVFHLAFHYSRNSTGFFFSTDCFLSLITKIE